MRKHRTEEQALGTLKEAELGKPAPELLRQHGIASGTFFTHIRVNTTLRIRRSRSVAFPRPHVIVQFFDCLSGGLLYAEPVLAAPR